MGIAQDPTTGDDVGRQVIYILDTNGNPARVTAAAPLPVSPVSAVAANVLDGFLSFAATGGPTTLVTVPAGRTWVGTVAVAVSVRNDAAAVVAGQARAVVTTAGAGATPAAGTVFAVEADAGANAVGGTVGTQDSNSATLALTVVAPIGNAVTIQVTATVAGTAGIVDVSATGALQ